MPAWICRTCAVQQPDTAGPPGNCPICDDERQYVGWGGQQWTTMAEIARDHAVVVREEEPGLAGIGSNFPAQYLFHPAQHFLYADGFYHIIFCPNFEGGYCVYFIIFAGQHYQGYILCGWAHF